MMETGEDTFKQGQVGTDPWSHYRWPHTPEVRFFWRVPE